MLLGIITHKIYKINILCVIINKKKVLVKANLHRYKKYCEILNEFVFI